MKIYTKVSVAILTTAAVILLAPASFAQRIVGVAYDNASAWAYGPVVSPGWQTGDNGGIGFNAWVLTLSSGDGAQNGFFIGSSTANGDGVDNGNVGGVAGDSDIDTAVGPVPDQSGDPDPQITSLRSWGLYANSGQTASAVRPFQANLTIGQTFSVNIDNGYVQTGGTVGIGLQNNLGNNLWELYFSGGGANYVNNDAGGPVATAIPYGDEGLKVDFTLTAANTYQVVLTQFGGATQTINGNLINPAGGQGVAQFRAFNFNAGAGNSANFYVNIPEPSSMTLVGLGLVGLLALRRRKA